jgi:hypothetical protein
MFNLGMTRFGSAERMKEIFQMIGENPLFIRVWLLGIRCRSEKYKHYYTFIIAKLFTIFACTGSIN